LADSGATHPFALMRARSHRPRRRAAEERNELAPSHISNPKHWNG
jgi:hypothetical protein